MIAVSDLGNAMDVILHPGKGTGKSLTLGGAFSFYYKVMLIPLILAILVAFLPASWLSSTLTYNHSGTLYVVIVILQYLILIPLGLLIDAAMYHLFGAFIFRIFKQDFTHTMTAMVYAELPAILLLWLFPIHIIGWAALMVAVVWGFITYLFAFRNQQKLNSKLEAFGVLVATQIVVLVIVTLIVLAIFVAIGVPFLHGLASSFPSNVGPLT